MRIAYIVYADKKVLRIYTKYDRFELNSFDPNYIGSKTPETVGSFGFQQI